MSLPSTEGEPSHEGSARETTGRKRYPLGAALLTFLVPGLGQLYNAQPKKAVVIYLLSLSLFPILALTTMAFTFHGAMFFLLVGATLLVFVIIDAAKNANRLGIMTLRKYNRWGIYVCIFFVHAFLITPLVEHFFPRPFKAYQMPTGGMMPTLQVGDHLIADLTYYAKHKPQRGDVPVFIFPEDKSKDFIQRIIGLPGETVEIRNKKVLINGQELSEPWQVLLNKNSVGAQDNFGPKVVPLGGYFLLGDNRDHSYDSRFWGFVDSSLIKGKALYLYWANDKGRIGTTIK
jgi:signal peptidase I